VNSASDTEHSYGSLLDYSSSNEINSHSVVILRHLRERLSPSHRILSFLSLSHPVSPFAPPHRLATVPSSLTINRSRCLRGVRSLSMLSNIHALPSNTSARHGCGCGLAFRDSWQGSRSRPLSWFSPFPLSPHADPPSALGSPASSTSPPFFFLPPSFR